MPDKVNEWPDDCLRDPKACGSCGKMPGLQYKDRAKCIDKEIALKRDGNKWVEA